VATRGHGSVILTGKNKHLEYNLPGPGSQSSLGAVAGMVFSYKKHGFQHSQKSVLTTIINLNSNILNSPEVSNRNSKV
jgi:hypothetical protein